VGFSTEQDGRVDAWRFFGPDGELKKIEYSTARDGQIDRVELYEGGRVVRTTELEAEQADDGR
jgi:hypothetical protein